MGYQGLFPAELYPELGIDKSHFHPEGPFEFWGKVNFMKAGISFADRITTVSPTYAEEIQQSDEFGKGLEGVLKERSEKLSGILNGVDYDQWSPERDSLIPSPYHISNLSGKKKNKLELLHKCCLPIRMEHPLIGMISRLDIQKGFDLLEEIMDEIMGLNVQFVLLGTGDEKYHEFFRDMEKKYPDRFKAFLMFDNKLAHLIEAGCDMFLMPSHYEPCGLNQLYSLKYGTVPIVRKTGGLADSVTDFDEASLEGTGFVFEKYDAPELLAAIRRAVELFPRKRIWYRIIKQGMQQDFSWDKSAGEYSSLYHQLMESN
jgi:starch synthase